MAAGSALGSDPKPRRRAQGQARSLRIAFLTDIHLDASQRCCDGLAACLKRVNSLSQRPDFIVQGGDLIYDALTRDANSVYAQYRQAAEVFKKNCSLPVEHVIGNHDIWGWLSRDKAALRADPRFGKGWWLTWTGYEKTYRSFDRGGWHFVVLDSMMPDTRHGYKAQLDAQQFNWLAADLRATPKETPVCLISHIPILSSAAMLFGDSDLRGRWEVPSWLMHIDARRLKDLLARHKNVRACLSGHVHLHNRVDYNGVKHIGHGAVCGAWWKGPLQETPPGFGVLDLMADGTVHSHYVTY